MRFSSLAGLVAALLPLVAIQSASACFVCDEVVEFDQIRAGCFLADYDRFEKAILESPDRRAEIDLSACARDVATGVRGIDAMPVFPTSRDGRAILHAGLRSIYILDQGSAACVRRLLQEREEPIDPSIRIHLSSACR